MNSLPLMGGYTPADFQNMGMPRLYYKLLRRRGATKDLESNLNASNAATSRWSADGSSALDCGGSTPLSIPNDSLALTPLRGPSNAAVKSPLVKPKARKPRSKIGRLPKDVQDNLNSMLASGHPYPKIIHWLNDSGYPGFNKVNLHDWRVTGFRHGMSASKSTPELIEK